ncbi:hypothetical protein [Actinomyces sp.]
MLTNKYDGPLNLAAVFALTVPAALNSFLVLLSLWLLWLTPLSIIILMIYFSAGQASTRFYYAAALSRRLRRGPDLALSNGGVGLTPMTAPIKLVTADFIQLAATFPISLIACALTHSPVLSSASTATSGTVSAVTISTDIFTVVFGLAVTGVALSVRRGTAYRLNTIHRGPILTLTPTHLEFHPLLEAEPVTIPWDRMPYLAGIDLVTVKRDSTKKARITTTGNPVPTTIDITCLDLTYQQLQRLIGCFACRPQYRGALATDGGVTLVRALIDDNPAGWPR